MLIGKNNLDKLKSKNGVHFLKDISLIGLISDTHIPEAGKSLWPEVIRIFKEVDLILHAGDMHDLSVLKELEEISPDGFPLLSELCFEAIPFYLFLAERQLGLFGPSLED